MRRSFTILFILTGFSAFCQPITGRLTGEYDSYFYNLKLRPDSTFTYKTNDPVFPYRFTWFENQGTWTASGNIITLNPGKTKRLPSVTLVEPDVIAKEQEGVRSTTDSIRIKINYYVETYDNDVMIGRTTADFHLMTLYINKRHNYHHLVHSRIRSICTFTPRIKKQVILDSSNIITLPRQPIDKIGILTYGFDKAIELTPVNPASTYFEIDIVQPIDKERTPRGKQVIIKGNRAYVREIKGKVRAAWYMEPLKRVNQSDGKKNKLPFST